MQEEIKRAQGENLRSGYTPTPKAYDGSFQRNVRKSPEFIHQSSVVNLKSMNISWDIQSELVKDSLAERDIRNVSNHRRNPELRVEKSREF